MAGREEKVGDVFVLFVVVLFLSFFLLSLHSFSLYKGRGGTTNPRVYKEQVAKWHALGISQQTGIPQQAGRLLA